VTVTGFPGFRFLGRPQLSIYMSVPLR